MHYVWVFTKKSTATRSYTLIYTCCKFYSEEVKHVAIACSNHLSKEHKKKVEFHKKNIFKILEKYPLVIVQIQREEDEIYFSKQN